MAHRSWCAENPGHRSNERLEFLGDAVLGWVTACLAFERFPEMSEGDLTGIRKGVVNATALYEMARELGLGEFIKLGRGEAATGGAAKRSILSDAFEALIGAVYLDRGSAAARELIERLIGDRLDTVAGRLQDLDAKSTLQEMVAALGRPAPAYVVSDTGPDHDKRFTAAVTVGGSVLGRGQGHSKRRAEQAAAVAAVRHLRAAAGTAPA